MFYTGCGVLVPVIWMLTILGCSTRLTFPIRLPLETVYTETRIGMGILVSSLLIFAAGKWLNRDKTPYERNFFGTKKVVSGGRHSFQFIAFEYWGLITLVLGLGGMVIYRLK